MGAQRGIQYMNKRLFFSLAGISALATISMAQGAGTSFHVLNQLPPEEIFSAKHLSRASKEQTLHLAINLPYGNPQGMNQFVASVSNPNSPNFRHFITPEEVGSRFGLQTSKVNGVVNYLKANGISIKLVGKNRLSILADATVAQAERAFNTRIETFAVANAKTGQSELHYSFTGSVSVPSELGRSVESVSGLENFTHAIRRELTPAQTRTLYNTAPLFSTGNHGEGRTIAISSWDGFQLSNATTLITTFGLPTPAAGPLSNVSIKTIDGGSQAGAESGEGDLDIQMVLTVAPLANVVIYDGNGSLIDVLTQEVNDNSADIITESYGWKGGADFYLAAHNLHLSLTAQGITYSAASGDNGTNIAGYPYPDTDPEVLIVGGTSVTTDASGNRLTETAWNLAKDGSGGGGGWVISSDPFNVLPSYQKGTGVPTNVPFRLVPDIALNADPNTGYDYFLSDGGYLGGGTSASSPIFAAGLALVEQNLITNKYLSGVKRLGRIQDTLYGFNGNSSVFFDVTSGNVGTLPNGSQANATAGWDFATGLGAVNFNGLYNALAAGTGQVQSISVSPNSFIGGSTTSLSGTVTLTSAAQVGGLTVALSSSDGSVVVPATVKVPSGSTTASFTVTSNPVGTNTTVTVTAAALAKSVTGTVTVLPPALSGLVAPSSIVGAASTTVTGTVSLASPAPKAGLVVSLVSNTPSVASVPTSVTVAGGQTSATFPITTTAVSTKTAVVVAATFGSVTKKVTLSVIPPTVTKIAVAPVSILGASGPVVATVTLNGPAPKGGKSVNVSSSDTTIATLASATAIVAEGQTQRTFAVSPLAVSSDSTVAIVATDGAVVKSANLVVKAATLTGVSLAASPVLGGTSASFTVTLSGPAGPAGNVVTLSSSNPGLASFATASVVVPSGKSTATVTVATTAVSVTSNVSLSGALGSTKTVTLQVRPANLSSLVASATSVKGNSGSINLTLTLEGANGPTARTVTLTSSSTTIVANTTVTIPAGASSVTVKVSPKAVTKSTDVTISATLGVKVSTKFTVTP
jgi:subtilase family serine protease